MTELKVDFCDHKAAEWAVMHWHYSRSMPAGKLVKIGAWEDGKFIGSIVFGRGAIYQIGSPFGLKQTQVCELVRVALQGHASPVSQIVSRAIKALKIQNDGLRLIVSYADPSEGHAGTIYQAMNWVYVGANTAPWKMVKGKLSHPRTLYSRYGTHSLDYLRRRIDPSAKIVEMPGKHKYLYPLDRAMRKQIAPLAKPYPKRDTRPAEGGNLATSEAGRFDPDQAALNSGQPRLISG